MEPVLYTNPMSRGRVVRWMLEEIGAPYGVEVVAYGPEMQSDGFLAMNPMGKVPVLRHGDQVITETPAILAYLADAFPEVGLAPASGKRGAYYRWLFFGAGPVEAAVIDRVLGVVVPEDKQGMVGYGTYEKMLETLENAVMGHGYLCGDQFTAADIYIGSHIGWGMSFGTLPELPAFKAYWERLSSRAACMRATALDDAAMPKTEG